MAAACEALLGNGLVEAAKNISIDAQTHVDEAAKDSPKRWLRKALEKRTAEIKSLKYITSFVADSRADERLDSRDAVIAEIVDKPGQFVALVRGKVVTKGLTGDLVPIRERLGWAAMLTGTTT